MDRSLIVLATLVLLTIVDGQEPPPINSVPLEEWDSEIEGWNATAVKPKFRINTAWLTLKDTLQEPLLLYLQHDQCFGCEVQLETTVSPGGNVTQLLQTDYGNHIEIRTLSERVICRSHIGRLRERGDYWLIVHQSAPAMNASCDLVLANDPPNYNLHILWAFLVFLGISVIWILIKKLYTHGKCDCGKRQKSSNLNDSTTILELGASFYSVNGADSKISGDNVHTSAGTGKNGEQHAQTSDTVQVVRKKQRLRSLDTFRGLSLVIMIFVNYGGGGYWFFQHAFWDGLLVADLVMPWFTWIMGTSMAFSFRGMIKRGQPRWRIFLRVLERSLKIFALGIFLMNGRNTPDMSTFRIPNVLQRLAFTYFITACVHLGFATAGEGTPPKHAQPCRSACPPLRDVLTYWPEWIIMLAILACQLALTYALPVPGCPAGYVGPGGLHEGGEYFNCTAGAALYIDKFILGENHIFQWPTIRDLYKTGAGYDPEGILGTLTSIFMCFLGLQAGKIIVTYKGHTSRCVRWLIWAIITGVVGTVLCKAHQTDGWVPLNKNLWSVSFILVLTSMAFILLILLYLIIDVGRGWTGAPFVYPGMNSIVVYLCHSLFSSFLPLTWQWPGDMYEEHWPRLLRGLWGCTLWTIMAYIMYVKKIFIAV